MRSDTTNNQCCCRLCGDQERRTHLLMGAPDSGGAPIHGGGNRAAGVAKDKESELLVAMNSAMKNLRR